MIYLTFIISMSLFVWAMVIVCKVTKRLSFMKDSSQPPPDLGHMLGLFHHNCDMYRML